LISGGVRGKRRRAETLLGTSSQETVWPAKLRIGKGISKLRNEKRPIHRKKAGGRHSLSRDQMTLV